jgi:Protein of unknown function (DUF3592)
MVLIGLALLAMGVSATFTAVSLKKQASGQPTWTQLIAVIISSEIRSTYEGYLPIIQYEYEYNNAHYTGETFKSAVVVFNFKGPAERILRKYRVGDRVAVYVNPTDPGQSVLEPAGSGPYNLLISVSSVAALIGLGLLFKSLS